jgi:putative ribosome biogenesis GTPase RsgA
MLIIIIILLNRLTSVLKEKIRVDHAQADLRLCVDYFLNKATEDYNLDRFIIEYVEYHLIAYGILSKEYLKEEEKKELKEKIVEIIQKRMSPAFIKYVSLTYEIKELHTIIDEKVTLLLAKELADNKEEE